MASPSGHSAVFTSVVVPGTATQFIHVKDRIKILDNPHHNMHNVQFRYEAFDFLAG